MSDAADQAIKRGETARRHGQAAAAIAAFAEAVEQLRPENGPRLAFALTRRAQIHRDQADLEAALADQEAAVALYRQDGGAPLAHALRHAGDILQDAGRPEAAAPMYAEMLALYDHEPATPPLELANALRSLAINAERLGDAGEARRLWTEARGRYAALDTLFLELTGSARNPGVAEADLRLAALS